MNVFFRFLAPLALIVLSACGASHDANDDDAGHSHDTPVAQAENATHTDDAHGDGSDADEGHADDDHAHDETHPAGDEHTGHAESGHDDDHTEGVTRIRRPIADDAGIRVAAAAPGTIRDEHEVQGLLTPIEGRHARIVARFPGPIRRLAVGVGDSVSAGQALAVIESNVSLSDYTVTAPLAGTVLARDASVGELAGDTPLFEIADLSKLWVDLHLFGRDAQHITPGLPVSVSRLSDGVTAATRLDRVLPATATASQSTVARATLDNTDGQWRPGAAVRARVTVSEDAVALAVPLSALQRVDGRDAVFVRLGEDDYATRFVALGRRDADNVEVRDGLAAGDAVVVEQSYLIKADIEKSGAGHDH